MYIFTFLIYRYLHFYHPKYFCNGEDDDKENPHNHPYQANQINQIDIENGVNNFSAAQSIMRIFSRICL